MENDIFTRMQKIKLTKKRYLTLKGKKKKNGCGRFNVYVTQSLDTRAFAFVFVCSVTEKFS